MTNSINEIAEADCILAIGTNTTAAHPVLALRIKDAVKAGGKLIVANPKRIDLVRYAELFLQHRPGTDVPLLMGIMRVIVDRGLHDEAFVAERCENWESFQESLADYPLDLVEWPMSNAHRTDLVMLGEHADGQPRTGGRIGGYAFPIDERHETYWDWDPWKLTSDGNGLRLRPGFHYLLAYYLGRFHGFIEG